MLHVPITLTSCVSNASAIFIRHVSTMDTSLPSCPSALIILSSVLVVAVVAVNGSDNGDDVPRDILFKPTVAAAKFEVDENADDDDTEESLATRLMTWRWVENDFTNIMLLSKDGMASSTMRKRVATEVIVKDTYIRLAVWP